jgi:hypothetical protein
MADRDTLHRLQSAFTGIKTQEGMDIRLAQLAVGFESVVSSNESSIPSSHSKFLF